MKFSDLIPGSRAHGLTGNGEVEILLVEAHGDNAATVTWRDTNGNSASRLVFEADLSAIKVEVAGRNWTFDADANQFLLASEARRLSMAHLFDPLLAVKHRPPALQPDRRPHLLERCGDAAHRAPHQ